MNIGHKHWTIAEGWIPPLGDETVAFLNVSPQEAHVQIFIYYSNRDPVGPYPRATEYASTIESDVPIVVQYPGRVSEEMAEAVTALQEMNESLISSGGNR